ncbi:MAG: signal peptidase II [Patescibacteria group bacterium]
MTLHRAVPPIVTAAGLFGVDRIVKWLAVRYLSDGGVFLVPDSTGVVFERNQGIAYGIPLPLPVLIVLVSVILIVTVAVGIHAFRRTDQRLLWGAALIFCGAAANAIDRIRYGWVVDTFVLTGWPVFNVADLMILAGAVLVAVHLIRRRA